MISKVKLFSAAILTSLLMCLYLVDFSWQDRDSTPTEQFESGDAGGRRVPLAHEHHFWEDVELPVDPQCASAGGQERLHSGLFPEDDDATLWRTAEATDGDGRAPKRILVWHSDYGPSKSLFFGLGRKPFSAACCAEERCVMTAKRDRMPVESFDAVLFHLRRLDRDALPLKRSRNQRWVVLEMESLSNTHPRPGDFDGLFNWTMTYRTDADVYAGYGYVYPKALLASMVANATSPEANSTLLQANVANSATNAASPAANSTAHATKTTSPAHIKTKLVAWMVSNCHSRSNREQLVRNLQKFIKVDIYGGCGTFKCPRAQQRDCYKLIERDYKFYLSFENSLWEDYVTEKFFNILRYNIVPVVLGLVDYSSLAPPHSYVDARLFPDAASLASFLLYLDRNDTAYQEYFKWKEDYVVYSDMDWSVAAFKFCALCARLHSDSQPKVYQHLQQWLYRGNRPYPY